MRSAALAVLALLGQASPAPGAEPGRVLTFEDCETLVREGPEELESYRCYWMIARRENRFDEAARRLEGLLSWDPENHRARLYLAAVENDRASGRALGLYREAAAGLAGIGDRTGEVYARLQIAYLLSQAGEGERSDAELEAAARAAEEAGDTLLLIRVRAQEGWQAYRGGDHGRSLLIFGELERLVEPDGPLDLRSQVVSGLAASLWATGRLSRALPVYRRQAEILEEAGDRHGASSALANAAFIALGLPSSTIPGPEVVLLHEEALAHARGSGNRQAEAQLLEQTASLVEPEEALLLLEEARGLRLELGHLVRVPDILRRKAFELAAMSPPRWKDALAAADEAADLARRTGNERSRATALLAGAGLRLRHGQRERGIELWLEALDVIEAMRDLQSDQDAQVRHFARWAVNYKALAGHLLDPAHPPGAEERELAFRVVERMRSRALLDRLDAARVTPGLAAGAASSGARKRVLSEISMLQRRLLDARLSEGERDEMLGRLEELERREAGARIEMARESESFARVRAPGFPTLQEIRDHLDEDQALLSFQVMPADQEVPSLLVVYTREETLVLEIPERATLYTELGLFLGLVERRDGSAAWGGARLYRSLLEPALDGLPPQIERLIIVPDEALFFLPFGALSAGEGEPSLAERYELSLVPSATLWHRWKKEGKPSAGPASLALADPLLPEGASAPFGERDGAFGEPPGFGALPFARDEARSLGRHLGRDSRILLGAEASERALKESALGGLGVLHFAAHALVDDERPSRSAVLLAPGAEEEDGLLQFREVLDLELDGPLVVLSSCRSASGHGANGEGVMGLAHAFFQAGARVVVGSLWPLRDEEAALLMGEFYRELGRGRSVAAALTEARRRRIADGAPAAAWAGMVVLGDGDHVPLPGGRPARTSPTWTVPLALVALASLLALLFRRRSHL